MATFAVWNLSDYYSPGNIASVKCDVFTAELGRTHMVCNFKSIYNNRIVKMAYEDGQMGARVQARLGRQMGGKTDKPTAQIEPIYAWFWLVSFQNWRTSQSRRQLCTL